MLHVLAPLCWPQSCSLLPLLARPAHLLGVSCPKENEEEEEAGFGNICLCQFSAWTCSPALLA